MMIISVLLFFSVFCTVHPKPFKQERIRQVLKLNDDDGVISRSNKENEKVGLKRKKLESLSYDIVPLSENSVENQLSNESSYEESPEAGNSVLNSENQKGKRRLSREEKEREQTIGKSGIKKSLANAKQTDDESKKKKDEEAIKKTDKVSDLKPSNSSESSNDRKQFPDKVDKIKERQDVTKETENNPKKSEVVSKQKEKELTADQNFPSTEKSRLTGENESTAANRSLIRDELAPKKDKKKIDRANVKKDVPESKAESKKASSNGTHVLPEKIEHSFEAKNNNRNQDQVANSSTDLLSLRKTVQTTDQKTRQIKDQKTNPTTGQKKVQTIDQATVQTTRQIKDQITSLTTENPSKNKTSPLASDSTSQSVKLTTMISENRNATISTGTQSSEINSTSQSIGTNPTNVTTSLMQNSNETLTTTQLPMKTMILKASALDLDTDLNDTEIRNTSCTSGPMIIKKDGSEYEIKRSMIDDRRDQFIGRNLAASDRQSNQLIDLLGYVCIGAFGFIIGILIGLMVFTNN